MESSCAECGARRGHLWGCSLATPLFPTPAASGSRPGEWTLPLEEARFELYARAVGVPLVMLGAWLFSALPAGAFLMRTFAGMWLHELGHASASWLTGYAAVPLPWFTAWSEERSGLVTLLVLFGLSGGIGWGVVKKRAVVAVWCGAALLFALVGRFGLSTSSARQLALFAGDAGAMVYGALMVTTFFARRTSRLVKGSLRWGFLGWGACAYADALRTWWESKKDFALLPFGLEDGQPSDATRLVEHYGWSEIDLIHRHLVVGVLCLVVLAGAWLWAVLQQRSQVRRVAAGEAEESPELF